MSVYPTISAGGGHNLVLDNQGQVWSFGRNNFGQLGLGIRERNIMYPELISGLPFIISISAGDNHSLVLDRDGQVWSFGLNTMGQLGLGPSLQPIELAKEFKPVLIKDLPPIQSISAGGNHSLVLDLDRRVWSFGNNRYGQLGLGHNVNQSKPTLIEDLPPITGISAGGTHSLISDQEGRVWSFGHTHNGQLGIDIPKPPVGVRRRAGDTDRNTPTLIDDIGDIISLSAGENHSLLLDEHDQVWSFGYGFSGQLGLGDHQRQDRPVHIENIPFIQEISAGGDHSLIRDLDGQVWRFGAKYSIQGDFPETEHQLIPELIEGLPFIASISAGKDHSLLLDQNGPVWSLGKNEYGQLGRSSYDTVIPGRIPYLIAKVPPRKSPFLKFVLTVYPLMKPYLADARINSYDGEDTIMELDLNDVTYLVRLQYDPSTDSFAEPVVSDEERYTQLFNELLKNNGLKSSSFRPDFYQDENGNQALEFEDLGGQRYLIRARP